MKFARIPFLNDANESETRIVRLESIEAIYPHDPVTVGGESGVQCCAVRFGSGATEVALLTVSEMDSHIGSLTGFLDEFGTLS